MKGDINKMKKKETITKQENQRALQQNVGKTR